MNSIERKQARYHRRKAKREAKRLEKAKEHEQIKAVPTKNTI